MTRRSGQSLSRTRAGVSLVELAAALVIGVPLLIAIIFVVLECSTYFNIKTKLDVASRQAARQLAIAYGKDPTIATNNNEDTNATIHAIYTASLIPGAINDIHQFDNPRFVTGTPGTVTVQVTYPVNGSYSLPVFPHPDPLHLSGKLQPTSLATFALE